MATIRTTILLFRFWSRFFDRRLVQLADVTPGLLSNGGDPPDGI
jgi:hypothetical protein